MPTNIIFPVKTHDTVYATIVSLDAEGISENIGLLMDVVRVADNDIV